MALLLLAGCQLTDHSERDEVTTDDIAFPNSGHQDVDLDEMPVIAFEATEHDMGKIIQGARVEHRFAFTNTGRTPLVLSDVRSVCGCTVAKDWPKDPIAPGDGGGIVVTFDSEGRTGVQHKPITVVANTNPPSTVLTLTGEVVGPRPSE
ncbi:MAG: DUF1573 domain-containing protein [Flavobacteriales bacterium]|nr:DUF1573 domain-containing protein [Flavobacteriales bacterium]